MAEDGTLSIVRRGLTDHLFVSPWQGGKHLMCRSSQDTSGVRGIGLSAWHWSLRVLRDSTAHCSGKKEASPMRTVATLAFTLITARTWGIRGGIPRRWGILRVPIVLALVWVSAALAHAPNGMWHTDGPADETVYSLAVAPSATASHYVYAGTTNAVSRADSATLNWSSTSNGLPTNTADGALVTVLSLAVDP